MTIIENGCLQESCSGDLEFNRKAGDKGWSCIECGTWFHESTISRTKAKKMSKSESKEANLIDDLSPESKLRAMENEKNYWKTRYELKELYPNVDTSMVLIRTVHDDSTRLWNISDKD